VACRLAAPASAAATAGTAGRYSLSYPNLALHAVCRDTEAYPHPCIYCQLDGSGSSTAGEDSARVARGREDVSDDEAAEGQAGTAHGEGEGQTSHSSAYADDLRFVPLSGLGEKALSSPSSSSTTATEDLLDRIYSALSSCAELHPDAQGSDEGDEEGGMGMGFGFGFGFGEGGAEEGDEYAEGEGYDDEDVYADADADADADAEGEGEGEDEGEDGAAMAVEESGAEPSFTPAQLAQLARYEAMLEASEKRATEAAAAAAASPSAATTAEQR
jgi:hypothetical protein